MNRRKPKLKVVGEPPPKPKKKKATRPEPEIPVRQLWAKPDPTSVHSVAAAAMDAAGDKILASAFRKLALAEANGLDLEPEDVIEWLGNVQQDITWLIDHLRTNLHVQRDIEALVVPDRRARCGHCDSWFVQVRTDSAYCSSRCRQAAYRHRKRYG